MDFRLSQAQTARLPRLLHMEYTLSELAEEIGVEVRHLRHSSEIGAPHRVTRQTTFVVGDDFHAWYDGLRAGLKRRLQPGEFYCLSCRKAVRPGPDQISRTAMKTRVIQETGECPICGRRINRFASEAAQ
jgi:uncharacterized protein with PIN domain